jgi:hypothetical protein
MFLSYVYRYGVILLHDTNYDKMISTNIKHFHRGRQKDCSVSHSVHLIEFVYRSNAWQVAQDFRHNISHTHQLDGLVLG